MSEILNPKISNYKALKEHFDSLGGDYKNAYEIYRDLISANKEMDLNGPKNEPKFIKGTGISFNVGDGRTSLTCVTIPYMKEYFDSGFVFFEYVGLQDGQRVFEFTNTGN